MNSKALTVRVFFFSLRPKQWIKNFFVFSPLLFSGRLLDAGKAAGVSLACVCFCLLSSAVYLLNDILDREEDKSHPRKSQRPVAKGELSRSSAILGSFLLCVAGFAIIAFTGNFYLGLVAILYMVINILYSLLLKHLIILDAITIAVGFVLRVYAGAAVLHIRPSAWLQICTFLLALFLCLGKRREDLLFQRPLDRQSRKIFFKYQLSFLDNFLNITAGLNILAYILYTLSGEATKRPYGQYLLYTSVFVIYGISRHLFLIRMDKRYTDPTEILISDAPLQINLLLWLFAVVLILYWPK
ncbi:MAG: decaprenyl-phosphate phosphoribosyltransferase [Candidatus Omnitrophota bacterium]